MRMDVVELDATPDLTRLLARAGAGALPSLPSLPRLLGRSSDMARSREADEPGDAAHPQATDDRGAGLPPTQVVVRDVPIDLDAVADYADVCGFRLSSDVPVTFPHILGFPLSVWLMTREDFPHPLLGLVHVRNQVVAREHLAIGATIDLTAHVVNQRTHAKGVQFDVVVRARRGERVVWASTSTYLRRGASLPDHSPVDNDREAGTPGSSSADTGNRRGTDTVDLAALPMTGRWAVPADMGRRYAAVSGDRNPIHLTAATAKAFGFPRAIAHGMWTKAAALAGLGTLPRPCTIDVAFRRPVLLPSTVEYATRRSGTGWEFGLRGRDGTPHLVGRVT